MIIKYKNQPEEEAAAAAEKRILATSNSDGVKLGSDDLRHLTLLGGLHLLELIMVVNILRKGRGKWLLRLLVKIKVVVQRLTLLDSSLMIAPMSVRMKALLIISQFVFRESMIFIEKLADVKAIAQGGYPEAERYQLLAGQSENLIFIGFKLDVVALLQVIHRGCLGNFGFCRVYLVTFLALFLELGL
ncbi:hypothetical protein Tco_1138492 [Tanacetum coccineum]